jgi:hypothetical protein
MAREGVLWMLRACALSVLLGGLPQRVERAASAIAKVRLRVRVQEQVNTHMHAMMVVVIPSSF